MKKNILIGYMGILLATCSQAPQVYAINREIDGVGIQRPADLVVENENVKEIIETRSALLPGATAPDFTLETPEGTKLSLSDLQGKYVLLDFWAYWCAPCRASFPDLKKSYEKYKTKNLEILSISVDAKKENWLKAIAEDKLPWKQVITGIEEKDKTISKLYAVPHIPYYYFIGPDGKIIAQPEGHEALEALFEKL